MKEVEFGSLVNFDKRFTGIDKALQKDVLSFSHVSAEDLKRLNTSNGDVKLLSTGVFDGYTTEELAGDKLCCGEVITIPTGGSANIKYYFGKFVDSGNILCSAKSDSICLKYVYYALLSKQHLIDDCFRGASIRHPQMSEIWKIKIPEFSLSVQKSIVLELDTINSIILNKKLQLEELCKLTQSVFHEMFGDPIENEMDWPTQNLGSCFKVTSSRRILQQDWKKDGIPFLKVSDIVNLIEGVAVTPEVFISVEEYNSLKEKNFVPQSGDILITSRGTLGQCYICKDTDRFYFQDGMVTWLTKGNGLLLPIFLKYLFKNQRFFDALCTSANKSTVSYLSISQLSKLPVILPSLDLQNKYCNFITSVESRKQTIQESIKELDLLKSQIMDKYFA